MVCTYYRENSYTSGARFIQPINRKMFLEKDDVVTLWAEIGSTNGLYTYFEVFEENEIKIS